jgi:hypothetical protein
MMDSFLGSFNKSSFDRFLSFARSQLPLIDARIQHLEAEIARIGAVVFKYDKGVPQGFASDPPTSYMGKLLAAYEVLGGNPFYDLRTRSMSDPIFVIKGTEMSPVQYISNGEVLGSKGLADGVTAELIHDARGWLEDTLTGRFGSLERKIRRAMDYADQLQEEIERLQIVKASAEVTGSLEDIANQIYQLFGDRNYRAIYDDKGSDSFGLLSNAPYSSYDGAPGIVQRENGGINGSV